MSVTAMDSAAGKGRSLGVNTWLIVLGISVLVFGLNTGYATWKAARLGGASSSASDLQVNSQKLAVQGSRGGQRRRRVVHRVQGNPRPDRQGRRAAQHQLRRHRRRFRTDQDRHRHLGPARQERRPGDLERNGGAGPGRQRRQLHQPRAAVAGAPGRAGARDVGLRLAVLAGLHRPAPGRAVGHDDRRITEIRAGGSGAALAGEALGRDAAVFGNVLTGLRKGDAAFGVTPLGNSNALAALAQAETLWLEMKKDLDAILSSSQNLFRAQAAAEAITGGSNKLLADSQGLFRAFTAFGSLQGHQHRSATCGSRSCPVPSRCSRSSSWCSRSTASRRSAT